MSSKYFTYLLTYLRVLRKNQTRKNTNSELAEERLSRTRSARLVLTLSSDFVQSLRFAQAHLVEAAVPPGREGRAVERGAPAADVSAFGPLVGELGQGAEYEAALREQQQQPCPSQPALAHVQRAVVAVAAAAP